MGWKDKTNMVRYQKWLKDPRYVFYQRAYTIIRDKRSIVGFSSVSELKGYLMELWEVQGGKCYYTGELMHLKGYTEKDKLAFTVDRLVPKLGYVRGNIALCCSIVNRIKQDLSISELKSWVNKISLDKKLSD